MVKGKLLLKVNIMKDYGEITNHLVSVDWFHNLENIMKDNAYKGEHMEKENIRIRVTLMKEIGLKIRDLARVLKV